MSLKTRLLRVAHYFVELATEMSTYRGLILMVSAGGWHRLDGTSKGELIAQAGMFLAGAIQTFIPSRRLYRQKPDA